ncbi:hypothetical protein K438DRAFT_1876354, partial [Mycena galopus ATCC 62051]
IPSRRWTAGCYGRSTVDTATSSHASAPGDKIRKEGESTHRESKSLGTSTALSSVERPTSIATAREREATDLRCGEWKHRH